MTRLALIAAAVALLFAAAPARSAEPVGWNGENPFVCTLQQAGFGTAGPRSRRRPVLRGVRQAPSERHRARHRRLPQQGARARRRRERQVLLLPVRPLALIGRAERRQHEALRVGRALLLRQGPRRGRGVGHELQRQRPHSGPELGPGHPARVRPVHGTGHRRRPGRRRVGPGRPALRRACGPRAGEDLRRRRPACGGAGPALVRVRDRPRRAVPPADRRADHLALARPDPPRRSRTARARRARRPRRDPPRLPALLRRRRRSSSASAPTAAATSAPTTRRRP